MSENTPTQSRRGRCIYLTLGDREKQRAAFYEAREFIWYYLRIDEYVRRHGGRLRAIKYERAVEPLMLNGERIQLTEAQVWLLDADLALKAITYRCAAVLIAKFRNHRSFEEIENDYNTPDARRLILDSCVALVAQLKERNIGRVGKPYEAPVYYPKRYPQDMRVSPAASADSAAAGCDPQPAEEEGGQTPDDAPSDEPAPAEPARDAADDRSANSERQDDGRDACMPPLGQSPEAA